MWAKPEMLARRMSSRAAQEPVTGRACFCRLNDRYGEFGSMKGRFGAIVPNVGITEGGLWLLTPLGLCLITAGNLDKFQIADSCRLENGYQN